MIEQLTEISKTIPLSNSHSTQDFQRLTHNCPKELKILSHHNSYILNAVLVVKKSKNPLEGIFQSFYLSVSIPGLGNAMRDGSHDLNLSPKEHINASNFNKYLKRSGNSDSDSESGVVSQQKTTKYNQFVEFDRFAIKLMMALRNEENYEFHVKQRILTVIYEGQQWKFHLQGVQGGSLNFQYISPKQTITLINTSQYLSRIQRTEASIPLELKSSVGQDSSMNQNSSILKQNLYYKQKIKQLESQMNKNNEHISEVLQQLKGIQKQLFSHGRMIEVQQNKIMKIIDDLQDIVQENNKAIKAQNIKKEKDKKQVTVPDFLREKLSIDLHSSFLNKFDISGSQITYIGEDKQATQLLSNRTFSHDHKPSHLHSTLFVKKTKAKCIKMGIIDSTYKNERSCWNYPNIIYMHGWGHTMVSKREQDHKNCDFGTGNKVEMEVDFAKGWIKWKIDAKREVKLTQKEVGPLLCTSVEWVPFIAMYNYMDSVQWLISQ